MHIKNTDGQSSPPAGKVSLKADGICILILLVISLCTGIYLISTTVLIAGDGVTFIEYAKGLETSPIRTIKSKYQHPGYPFLIAAAHKIAEAGWDGCTLQSWIYSAQAAALALRTLTIVLLYFWGRKIVGRRFSFLAILILIVLPDAAEYGSDTLSDWPHIFFLSASFLLLVWGAEKGKWWMFGFSGAAAGAGYLIRPECAQVVVLGTLWLGFQIFHSGGIINRRKAAFAFILMVAAFLAVAGPYMKLKGAIFPKKQLIELAANTELHEEEIRFYPNSTYTTSFAPIDAAKAAGKLGQRVGETLMWFFVPALLAGLYKHFRRRDWSEPEKFFVIAFIVLNVFIMTLLYCKFGYMSRRHTLPLVVLTIFYVPTGIETLACWISKKKSETATNFWFIVLVIIGIAICIPKLLMPTRTEKQTYRDAARWLAKNTRMEDIIAVPDIRIGFYAERSRSIKYNNVAIPKEARYVVRILEDEKEMPSDEGMSGVKEVYSTGGKDNKSKIIIYRQNQP
jgi:hypothetical protein